MTAVIVILVAASTYVILALTLVVVSQPINGKLYLVNRVGVADGAAPAGTTLLMDLDNNGTTWSQRWTSTTWRIHRPIVVEVLWPHGSALAVVENGLINAHRVSPSQGLHVDSAPLSDSYLVTCRAGECTPGTTLLVPASHTIGTVLAAIPF